MREPVVFISYARADQARVEKLHQALELTRLAGRIWRDTVNTPGGEQWQRQIVETARDALAILVIVSETSRKSEWVGREASLANTFKRKLVPVLIDKVDLSAPDTDPALLLFAHQTQWLDAHVEAEAGRWTEIALRIERAVLDAAALPARPAPSVPSPPPAATGPTRWLHDRRIVGGFALSAVAIIAIVGWNVWPSPPACDTRFQVVNQASQSIFALYVHPSGRSSGVDLLGNRMISRGGSMSVTPTTTGLHDIVVVLENRRESPLSQRHFDVCHVGRIVVSDTGLRLE